MRHRSSADDLARLVPDTYPLAKLDGAYHAEAIRGGGTAGPVGDREARRLARSRVRVPPLPDGDWPTWPVVHDFAANGAPVYDADWLRDRLLYGPGVRCAVPDLPTVTESPTYRGTDGGRVLDAHDAAPLSPRRARKRDLALALILVGAVVLALEMLL